MPLFRHISDLGTVVNQEEERYNSMQKMVEDLKS
jgi:hypothetical protein